MEMISYGIHMIFFFFLKFFPFFKIATSSISP